MKYLYYGGCGVYKSFTAAGDDAEAIRNIQAEPGMAAMPVTARRIETAGGLTVVCLEANETVTEVEPDGDGEEPAGGEKPEKKPRAGRA